MIAVGFTPEGHREVIGFGLYDSESKGAWKDFFRSLKARGLRDPKMITSDANDGIIAAISDIFPKTPWQRCQYHFEHDILEATPKKYQKGLSTELREMFRCENISDARKRRDEIIKDYADVAENAMTCLDEGFEDSMTVMTLPKGLRQPIRKSNHIERLNRELKRRSKVIGIFPNRGSVVRLIGSVLIDRNDEWVDGYRLFYTPAYDKLAECVIKLEEIAKIQHDLRSAA